MDCQAAEEKHGRERNAKGLVKITVETETDALPCCVQLREQMLGVCWAFGHMIFLTHRTTNNFLH